MEKFEIFALFAISLQIHVFEQKITKTFLEEYSSNHINFMQIA